jgi:hypothetical protein
VAVPDSGSRPASFEDPPASVRCEGGACAPSEAQLDAKSALDKITRALTIMGTNEPRTVHGPIEIYGSRKTT